jgi:hypothetical protein
MRMSQKIRQPFYIPVGYAFYGVFLRQFGHIPAILEYFNLMLKAEDDPT